MPYSVTVQTRAHVLKVNVLVFHMIYGLYQNKMLCYMYRDDGYCKRLPYFGLNNKVTLAYSCCHFILSIVFDFRGTYPSAMATRSWFFILLI